MSLKKALVELIEKGGSIDYYKEKKKEEVKLIGPVKFGYREVLKVSRGEHARSLE